MLFNSNMRFLKSGYSCHLLTIELISERGYEVKFLLLLFRLGSRRVGEQNDHLNCYAIQTWKGRKTPGCPGRKWAGQKSPQNSCTVFTLLFCFFYTMSASPCKSPSLWKTTHLHFGHNHTLLVSGPQLKRMLVFRVPNLETGVKFMIELVCVGGRMSEKHTSNPHTPIFLGIT